MIAAYFIADVLYDNVLNRIIGTLAEKDFSVGPGQNFIQEIVNEMVGAEQIDRLFELSYEINNLLYDSDQYETAMQEFEKSDKNNFKFILKPRLYNFQKIYELNKFNYAKYRINMNRCVKEIREMIIKKNPVGNERYLESAFNDFFYIEPFSDEKDIKYYDFSSGERQLMYQIFLITERGNHI